MKADAIYNREGWKDVRDYSEDEMLQFISANLSDAGALLSRIPLSTLLPEEQIPYAQALIDLARAEIEAVNLLRILKS